jgi:hypothetical protein
MTKAEIYGSKVYMALRKLPEAYIPFIIGYLLRQYERYGLAELVENGWDWKPKEGKVIEDIVD